MIYRGTVTRVTSGMVFVQIPRLGHNLEFGPYTMPSGMVLAANDQVILASVGTVKEDLVILSGQADDGTLIQVVSPEEGQILIYDGTKWVNQSPGASMLIFKDTFTRTLAGQWGSPDQGPVWEGFYDDGGTASVAGGSGIFTLTLDDDYVVYRPTDLTVTDAEIWGKGLRPSVTPTGDGLRIGFELRSDFDDLWVAAAVLFHSDGTAEARTNSANESTEFVSVPGVTTSQPVDIYVRLIGDSLKVWVALSSVGIDLTDPPLVSRRVTVLASGSVMVLAYAGAGATTPITASFDEIAIYTPALVLDDLADVSVDSPRFGQILTHDGIEWVNSPRDLVPIVKDTFDRTETGQWGTPNKGVAWENRNVAGGDPSVSSGFGLHTLDSAANSVATQIDYYGVQFADGAVYARSVGPQGQLTPAGAAVQSNILLRRDAPGYVVASVEWQTDGTALLELFTSAESGPSTAIFGVDDSQPVDIFMRLIGTDLDVWVALSRIGIDLTTPPTLSMTVSVVGAGLVVVETTPNSPSLDVTPPYVMRYGEITVYKSVVPALDDLADVKIASPATGHVLRYSGAQWVNTVFPLDLLSDVIISSPSALQVVRYDGTNWVNATQILDNFNDVVISAPASGHVLKHNGTTWINGQVTANELATDAVTNVKMANDSVNTNELVNASVTSAKLALSAYPNVGHYDTYESGHVLNTNPTLASYVDVTHTTGTVQATITKQLASTRLLIIAGGQWWSETNVSNLQFAVRIGSTDYQVAFSGGLTGLRVNWAGSRRIPSIAAGSVTVTLRVLKQGGTGTPHLDSIDFAHITVYEVN